MPDYMSMECGECGAVILCTRGSMARHARHHVEEHNETRDRITRVHVADDMVLNARESDHAI